jgi:hypothetical protein
LFFLFLAFVSQTKTKKDKKKGESPLGVMIFGYFAKTTFTNCEVQDGSCCCLIAMHKFPSCQMAKATLLNCHVHCTLSTAQMSFKLPSQIKKMSGLFKA